MVERTWQLLCMAILGLSLGFSLGLPVCAQSSHPFELSQPANAPEHLLALIEIAEGSQVKYEIDPNHGGLVVDRFLPDEYRYPAHYGGLPSVYASDGDLLDVMVISKHRLQPGALIQVRPIGLARMLDGGERDDKILAIPLTQFQGLPDESSISDWLGSDMAQAIASFFKGYKHSESEDNPIQWQGYGSSSEARQVIEEAMAKMPQANQAQTHLPQAHSPPIQQVQPLRQ